MYIDLIRSFLEVPRGNKYIVSMVDDLIRFVDFATLRDEAGSTVTKLRFNEILSRYFLPRVIVTDQGSSICSLMS